MQDGLGGEDPPGSPPSNLGRPFDQRSDTTAEPEPPASPGHPQETVDSSDSSAPDTQHPVDESRFERRTRLKVEKSRRRRRRAIIVALSLVSLVVLIVAAGAGYLWYENHRIHRVAVKHLSAVQTSGIEKDVENILLIGSTTRCGLAQQNAVFGLCDQGITGVNSDVVMILHLDPDHHRAAILSIPRDTLVPNARHDGINKIDAALGDVDGPGQLIAAITDDFGIPIQHYVELNFDSFQGVVQALGGIKMYFPMPLFDRESSLYEPNSGCTDLNGFEALALVRARHLQYQPGEDAGLPRYDWPYDPQSDLSRIRRDHEFLRVLASAVAHRGLGNFVTDLQLINSVAGNLEVDQSFSAVDMADLVLEFHHVDPLSVPEYTLPVVVDGQSYYYEGGAYGDVVLPVEPEDAQVVAQFLGTKPTEDSAGNPLPSAGSFTVAVENGSGLYNGGSSTTAALEALGYHVNSVTYTPVPADTSETTVLYSQPDQLDDALKVMSDMSGLVVLGYDPGIAESTSSSGSSSATSTTSASADGETQSIDVGTPLSPSQAADVVVVTGSNFEVDSAPGSSLSPSSTSTTESTSTTTSTSASSSSTGQPGQPGQPGQQGASTTTSTIPAVLATSPNLSAPSSAVEALEPWDPRSCTPGGGEGP